MRPGHSRQHAGGKSVRRTPAVEFELEAVACRNVPRACGSTSRRPSAASRCRRPEKRTWACLQSCLRHALRSRTCATPGETNRPRRHPGHEPSAVYQSACTGAASATQTSAIRTCFTFHLSDDSTARFMLSLGARGPSPPGRRPMPSERARRRTRTRPASTGPPTRAPARRSGCPRPLWRGPRCSVMSSRRIQVTRMIGRVEVGGRVAVRLQIARAVEGGQQASAVGAGERAQRTSVRRPLSCGRA